MNPMDDELTPEQKFAAESRERLIDEARKQFLAGLFLAFFAAGFTDLTLLAVPTEAIHVPLVAIGFFLGLWFSRTGVGRAGDCTAVTRSEFPDSALTLDDVAATPKPTLES
jgi:hypothetical protein